MKINKSEYVILSRIICRLLFKEDCWGKGSLYFDNLVKGVSNRQLKKLAISKEKINAILEALIKQRICSKKKKKYGWKYYLNMERYDKIKQIVQERGHGSIILLLLELF